MSYFRELPNIRYPSFLKEKTSSFDYVEAKGLYTDKDQLAIHKLPYFNQKRNAISLI